MDRRERLIAAKALIEQKGWAQGMDAIGSEAGAPGRLYCVATALCAVGDSPQTNDGEGVFDDMEFFAKTNDIHTFNRYGMAHWNDAPERTKEQVLAAFDRAIAAAGSPN